ncbi:MAG TPA: hypothetical protein VN739_03065 [Nitrososphaerales archaeon]|nr:hypothetical protein [Nitrososphaerales archaeon]
MNSCRGLAGNSRGATDYVLYHVLSNDILDVTATPSVSTDPIQRVSTRLYLLVAVTL